MKKPNLFQEIKDYLEKGIIKHNCEKKFNLTVSLRENSSLSSKCHITVSILQEILTGSQETDVIDIPANKCIYHPTQKPTRLIERLINIVTEPDDIVLDSFMGSCTTGVACINTGRRFIGMELSIEYFNVAQMRINKAILAKKEQPDLLTI